jgi:hypothetical protein
MARGAEGMLTSTQLALQGWERSEPRPSAVPSGRNIQAESSVVCAAKETFRLALPRRGHVLSTVVEVYGKPIREAAAALSGSLARKQCSTIRASLFSPRDEQLAPDIGRSDAEMAAWAIVSMWVVGVAAKVLPVAASLAEAEQWFFGLDAPDRLTRLASDEATRKAEAVLRSEANASAYFELLPYILDPHGPGSRLSVRRNPATRAVQTRKRAEGVFYTPADVAEYMTAACLAGLTCENLPAIFDPACGTGVFLRAALQELRRRHPERNSYSLASECLFGADIDPWPLDASAFVLVADSWNDLAGQGSAPAEAWHRLRLNLACIDTLRIDPAGDIPKRDGRFVSQNDRTVVERISISRLFPAMERGPTVILGNPPYANLGRRSDLSELGRVYETLAVKPEPNAEIYLPFIEQMIRLADQEICSGALVLPLSIACNVGRQFSATRKLISKTRGRWRFAFFDREPHALFGEDVKTRNAIMLWSRIPSNKTSILATGPLRKWRGDSRAVMFKSLQFTVVDGDIRAGIPKIDGGIQAAALKTLGIRWGRLEQVVHSIERCNLAETSSADERTVFVGPTAYNFLNVFVKPERGLLHGVQALSEHPLHAVRCSSRRDAFAVFATLSSHLAYWWWHTHGDGFHVSRRFLADLPFGLEAFATPVKDILEERGAELWSAIKKHPIISLNRGRTSLAYTPNGHDDIRRKIDQALADLVGLEEAFVDELQQFTARTVAATLRKHAIAGTEEKERT